MFLIKSRTLFTVNKRLNLKSVSWFQCTLGNHSDPIISFVALSNPSNIMAKFVIRLEKHWRFSSSFWSSFDFKMTWKIQLHCTMSKLTTHRAVPSSDESIDSTEMWNQNSADLYFAFTILSRCGFHSDPKWNIRIKSQSFDLLNRFS